MFSVGYPFLGMGGYQNIAYKCFQHFCFMLWMFLFSCVRFVFSWVFFQFIVYFHCMANETAASATWQLLLLGLSSLCLQSDTLRLAVDGTGQRQSAMTLVWECHPNCWQPLAGAKAVF